MRLLSLFLLLALAHASPQTSLDQWPQVGGNAFHYGNTPFAIGRGKALQQVAAPVNPTYFRGAAGLVRSTAGNFTGSGRGCVAVSTSNNGTLLWSVPLPPQTFWDNYQIFAPALAQDEAAIYWSCLGVLSALDPKSGALLWNVSSPSGMPVIGPSGPASFD